jgi:hypothetical protein
LIENPNKIAVLKTLPLTKKKKYLLASMSWDQGNITFYLFILVANNNI